MKSLKQAPAIKSIFGVFLILLFFGALFWAKAQDPFVRKWFSIKAAGVADGHRETLKCVAVLPKPVRACPVVIYAHGSGGSLMTDGQELRQMAEMGLATVSLEYDQTNDAAFNGEFDALLHYLSRQEWADTNAIAWVGFSLGANRIWKYTFQHPQEQPQLLVLVSGQGLAEGETNVVAPSFKPRFSTLLIHTDQDETFPVGDTLRLASVLRTNHWPVDVKILPNLPHGLEPDRKEVFRGIGEYGLMHLAGTDAWRSYHSLARYEAAAPAFGWFCLPAVGWVMVGFSWRRWGRPAPIEPAKLTRSEIGLRWLAVVLAIWAAADTALHVLPPYFPVSQESLNLARKYIVPPKEQADFDWLAEQPIWSDVKLRVLLEQAKLANYNRELINWQLGNGIYQKYVLSPIITGKPGELLNWRRPLWEEFYPRIRHESSPSDAAVIVARHLRERVTVANIPNSPRQVPDIWLRQITDPAGFPIVLVAALRAVGVPARLDADGHAEFFDGEKWGKAPNPAVMGW